MCFFLQIYNQVLEKSTVCQMVEMVNAGPTVIHCRWCVMVCIFSPGCCVRHTVSRRIWYGPLCLVLRGSDWQLAESDRYVWLGLLLLFVSLLAGVCAQRPSKYCLCVCSWALILIWRQKRRITFVCAWWMFDIQQWCTYSTISYTATPSLSTLKCFGDAIESLLGP